ncbi:MAG TPA: hypothetical protein PK275_03760 [Chitinophagaceae bacterium]|nr:hypothetical protein [Chitinophagaceae bacterium]
MITAAIRQKIEARYGKPLRYSKDCDGLANSINKVCHERVSITTLKRLFGFAKSVEQPRLYTLDIIATYIGYKDWSSLLANIEKAEIITAPGGTKSIIDDGFTNDIHLLHHQISISLTTQTINTKRIVSLCRQLGKGSEIFPFIIEMISIAARQKNIQFLKQVFNMPVIFDEKIHSPVQMYYVGQTMGLMFRSHPDIADELTESLAVNKNAQRYFIEWFVDEDYLQGYYGKLLDAYHRQKQSEVQDKLFYFALKFSQAVQSGNVIQRIGWYKKIKGLKISAHIHEIPAARYIGICLSEESCHHFNATSPYYMTIQQYAYVKDYEKALGFALYLCRELFRSMRTDWLVQVVNDFEKHHEKPPKKAKTHWGAKGQNELLIYKTYANVLQGNKRKASQYFKSVDSNLFDPFIYQQMHKDYIFVAERLKEK